jgi:polar amino acid transport system permease protein
LLSLIAFIGSAIETCWWRWRARPKPAGQFVSGVFIQIFQGTPLLLQLFFGVFRRAGAGDINPWVAAGVALILNSSAFLGEIWRGCVGRFLPASAESAALKPDISHAFIHPAQAFKSALAPRSGYGANHQGHVAGGDHRFPLKSRAGQIINNAPPFSR